MDISNVYWYNFTSGSYDSYGYDGTYYSTEYIEQEVWEDHLNGYNAKKAELYAAIPLKDATGYRVEFPRKVIDFDTAEAKVYHDFIMKSNPISDFIAQHNLIALEIERDFHDGTT